MVWRLLEGGAYLRPVAYTESLDDKLKVEVSIYSKPYIQFAKYQNEKRV